MSSAFFEKSKEIANNFMQSIVFLDDRAYGNDGNRQAQDAVHDLNAYEISKIFAKQKKICAVYDPTTTSDISDFKLIAKKADVIILDWFIDLQDEELGENQNDENNQGALNEQQNDEEDADDGEEDVEQDDIRGIYTLDIILDIIEDQGVEPLKLIVVYTGETDLEGIVEEILGLKDTFVTYEDDICKVSIGNLTILVRAKSNNQDGVDTRFNHLAALRSKVLKYHELPEFVLTEFTKLTSGLLSNFALLSLSALRNNTSKILGLYNKQLDHAYLDHKSSIPNTEDAENLMIEIFKDSIGDLLYYKQLHKKLGKKEVSEWIDYYLDVKDMSLKTKTGTLYNPDVSFKRNKNLLMNLIFSEEINVQKKFINAFAPALTSKTRATDFFTYLKSNNIELFINDSQIGDKEKIIADFAKLTHHKNAFLPRGLKPILSLGTVLKSDKTDKYFICIQQKCDSVRIIEKEGRKFLFIPLLKVEGDKFNFITHDHVKLKLETKSYSLRTLKFKSNRDGYVESRKYKNKFYFNQLYNAKKDEKFQWILDLKDLHAQRIVADYAANLSRVGLNESEWLRNSGTNLGD